MANALKKESPAGRLGCGGAGRGFALGWAGPRGLVRLFDHLGQVEVGHQRGYGDEHDYAAEQDDQ